MRQVLILMLKNPRRLKVDKTKAVMEERMSGGKSKTVVYPFDEAVHYTNEGAVFFDRKTE